MHLAIIGSGQVGQALATTFRRTGHEVVFGVRDPATDDPAQRPVADAVAAADIAILAVPYAAALDLIRHPAFEGKTVIDATNPLAMGPDGLTLVAGHTTSGAEQIAAAGPKSRVVKAFNQTGFENMANPRRFAAEPLMFVAGDHADANATVVDLAAQAGFEAIELGGLAQARLLEPLAMIWIELARKQGTGPGFAFAFTRER